MGVTMQDTIIAEVGKLIDGAGLAMVQAPDWANTGTLHAMRGVEPVLAVGYGFFGTYGTLSLSGPAVEQAPFGFLAGQDRLKQNRVCRAGVPLVHITPGSVADRSHLSIEFHYLEYAKPGEIRGFLDVVRQLLSPQQPEVPGTGQMIRDIADREGWTDATLLSVLMDYLASQPADDALRSYLETSADVDQTARPAHVGYTVSFEYTVEDVAGRLEAAMHAYHTLTDPQSMRPIATVISPDGKSEEIDLQAEEC